MRWLGHVGAGVLARLGRAARTAAMVWAVLSKSVRPGTWTAPMRNVLARQILFTGLEATGFVSLIALIVGVLVVVQAQYWRIWTPWGLILIGMWIIHLGDMDMGLYFGNIKL